MNKPIYLNEKSKGKVVEVSGLKISIPKKPSKGILGYRKSKNNQKWERTPLPENWDVLDNKSKSKFIEQEFNRREQGIWFYNNGEPTYITGAHYYYLNWGKIDIGYPDYRDRDRRFFIFWDACVKDDRCFGMQMIKHRREGASWKGASLALYYATSNYNAHGGLLSKTGADAKDLFFKVVDMFRSLPDFFQPIIDGTDNPKSVLSFKKPGERITKTNKVVKKSEALNSKIDWRNTRNNSYDSAKLKYFMSDEAGKWEEADVWKNWQIVKPCLTQGRNVVGKCFMPSTVNEMTKGGGQNYKKIWDMSDPDDRDSTGRTRSGLYRYFTPVYDGLEGFIDDYGMSMKKEAKDYTDDVRKGLQHDTRALSENKRQYPYTPDEAFRSDSKNCLFDTELLYQQIEYSEVVKEKMTTSGNFIWRNNEKDTEVVWMPDRNGKWLVSWLPTAERRNITSVRKKGTFPGNEATIVSGCDPYDHSTTTDGRRSDAAAYIFKKYDMTDPDNSHIFVAEYINRPPKVEAFYEDMLKQCIFYSCQILVENNRVGLINYFELRGYGNYLMVRPETTHTASSRKQTTKGIPTSGQVVINAIADSIQAYIYDNIGINPATGEMGKCYFTKLLNDWLNFDIDNRTKYDASMASGITLIAAQKFIAPKVEKKPFMQFVRKYNNNGNLSKAIN